MQKTVHSPAIPSAPVIVAVFFCDVSLHTLGGAKKKNNKNTHTSTQTESENWFGHPTKNRQTIFNVTSPSAAGRLHHTAPAEDVDLSRGYGHNRALGIAESGVGGFKKPKRR